MIIERDLAPGGNQLNKVNVSSPPLRDARAGIPGGRGELRWDRYCGFFDFTAGEFEAIQLELLRQQLAGIGRSAACRQIFQDGIPGGVEELRSRMPFTTYADYADHLDKDRETAAASRAISWVFTTTTGGSHKWVPYTAEAIEKLFDSAVAAVLQASAKHKGDINIAGGETILNAIAPSPFLTGIMLDVMCERLGLRLLPPAGESHTAEFAARIERGLQLAVTQGLDIVGSLPSVLVKIGEMTSASKAGHGPIGWPSTPQQLSRLAGAFLRSRLLGRPVMPRDIWSPKALLSWGLDTDSYRPRIRQYWGKDPLEFYGCTEAGILGIQGFNRKGLTLLPYSAFLEFIPEEEWTRGQVDRDYRPSTVLLGELKAGKRYEIVLTSFHGMPFVRYRVGHLLKVVSNGDEETGSSLPQVALAGRADQTIDIGGFTRLDERTLLDALSMCTVEYGDWVAAREIHDGSPLLCFYVEANGGSSQRMFEETLDSCLKKVDPGYDDLDRMLGVHPLRLKLLPPGTFDSYRERANHRGSGAKASGLPRINPPSDVIDELVYGPRDRELTD